MKSNTEINKLVEDTMQLAVASSPVSPPPFLFTRVMARLQNRQEDASPPFLFAKPVYAYAAVICLILINLFVFLLKTSSTSETAYSGSTLADEYSYSVNTIYDTDNLKP